MELRWLKGNWEHGKFKLQYRKQHPMYDTIKDNVNDVMFTPWLDVPIAESKPKDKTLEEKLAETSIVKGDATCWMAPIEKSQVLAKIARQHFKEGGV